MTATTATPPARFYLPVSWLDRPVSVWLLGVGGTGSELLDGLVRLHHALLALGHPVGLQVTAWDGDTVSPANIGRQRFWAADIGHNKAVVAIHRYNLFAGLAWEARPGEFTLPIDSVRWPDLLLTCVDKAGVRAALGQAGAPQWTDCLWLDCGNDAYQGQVILGHLGRVNGPRLPSVYDFYSAALSHPDLDADEQPSCGLAAALNRQSLAINRLLADLALALLYDLFRAGSLDRHGQFVDLRRGMVTPLLIDPDAWAFLGYAPAA
jgi:PRTRC genetic system ThiF family protein